MADGGATYTVNIELATRQFSQDLRNLKNKIQTDLGKAVKIGGKQGTTTQQRAQQIREKRIENEEARKRFYNADKINAFRVRQGRITAENNKLGKIGLDVEKRQKDIGRSMEAAEEGRFQWAEAKLKVAKEQVKQDFKDLDLINKQAAAEKKAINDKAKEATRLENKARRGRYGQRMHGPIDRHGTQIYDGYKNPPIPKRGAALPIDLQRKGTGTFAKSHTRLLRRRQNLETLLSTFEGISSPEIKNFKNGIQGLVKRYGAISTSMGQTRNASGFGDAGEIGRELKELDNLTHREEQRAKRIQVTNKQELDFLNQKHRIEKLLARFDKKGVNTTSKRLQLEKAVTAQDKQQLDALLRQFEIENIGLKGVSGTGGGKKGPPNPVGKSSRLNVQNGYVMPGPVPTGRGARMAQSALISGGFPLLFGQNPAVAAVGAAGGAIGEAITPGGGFAGGIAATALTTAISQAVAGVGELGKALNRSTFDVSRLSKALGASGTATEKYLTLLKENEGKQAAYEEGLRRMNRVVGIEGVAALQEFSANMEEGSRGLSRLGTQISAWFADLWINRLRDKGILGMGGVSKFTKPFDRASLRSQAYANEDPLMKTLIGKRDAAKLGTDARFDYDNRIIELQKFFNLMDKSKDKALEISEYEKKSTRSITDKNLLLQETLQYGTEEANIRAQIRQLERMYLADGKELTKEKKKQIALDLQQQANLQRSIALYRDIGSTIKSGLVEGINAAIDGTKSLGEIAGNVFRKISDSLLDFGVSMALSNLPIPGAKKFFGFANGGRPPKGRPSIVGERGPELFVPDSAGTIIPNHEMGGANVVVNVDASGSSVEGDAGAAQELGSMLAAAIQAELVKEKRPGGLLA